MEIKTRGRPKDFDVDLALEKALMIFWEKGFDITSINDLTIAMNITPPSLYSTFGNKEKLFWAAVDLYTSKYSMNISKLLGENSDTKEAFHRILKNKARVYTSTRTPHGCLIVCATSNHSASSIHINEVLKKMRIETENLLIKRIRLAIKLGELPATVNAKQFGKYFATIIQGMSIQSKDGASTKDLESLADLAMSVWPTCN